MEDEVISRVLVDHNGHEQHFGLPQHQRVCLSDGEVHRPTLAKVKIVSLTQHKTKLKLAVTELT